MKHYFYVIRDKIIIFILLIITTVVLLSCETYNFSSPQPVDKENLYEFPAFFRGYWVDDENETLYIDSKFLWYSVKDSEKVIAGSWPRLTDSGTFLHTPFLYKSFKTIQYDSLRNPIDTFTNYLQHENKVYQVNTEGLLEKGFNFQLQGDTFTILRNDTTIIDLGHYAFLRKVNHDIYTLNICNNLLGEKNNWWQLFILEKKNDDKLNVWMAKSKLSKHPAMFFEEKRNYYFDIKWTGEEILSLMKDQYFDLDITLCKVSRSKE